MLQKQAPYITHTAWGLAIPTTSKIPGTDEVKSTYDVTKYISGYKDLFGKEKSINVDKTFLLSKYIMAILSMKKITPIVDDYVFYKLLKDMNIKNHKLIISDNGQGLLPYEGNCGFLTMSRFLIGQTQEYYWLRIFLLLVQISIITTG